MSETIVNLWPRAGQKQALTAISEKKELALFTQQHNLQEIILGNYFALVILLPKDISGNTMQMQNSSKWKHYNF